MEDTRVQLDTAGPGSHSAALCDRAHAEPWVCVCGGNEEVTSSQVRNRKHRRGCSEVLRGEKKPKPAEARH